jgi:acyl-CoA dehydrogenase
VSDDAGEFAGLDLRPSEEAVRKLRDLRDFMGEKVYPAERADGDASGVLAGLKAEARARGLWNLCLPSVSGLGNLDYAYLAEETGRSPDLAPAAINGGPPNSVNMVMLDELATPDQRERWLAPLLDDAFSSAFAMTEPDVASSDASNIATEIARDGDDYVVTGRKWFASSAADPRCRVLFVLGRTDPDAPPHRRHSVLAVPMDTPGVEIVRTLPVMGRPGDHAEIVFDGARVPARELIGDEGAGFAAGQVRLGAARVQHCMRLIGLAERGLALLARRAEARVAFGGPLSAQGLLRAQVAECRLAIDQARMLVLRTAALVDAVGARRARTEISAIKVAVLRAALLTLDRAIQVHGALGVTDDVPLARWWTHARGLHIADGPEEVHLEVIARTEFRRHREATA